MPSCWPPVAWPSLPCSTSCSDPARRIRKTTPDVRRSPCRWASFFVPPDCRGRCARGSLAAPLPHSRRTALGVSIIGKKDEKRGTANLRKKTYAVPSVMAGLHEHPGNNGERTDGARRRHRACQSLPDSGRIGRAPHMKEHSSLLRDRTGRRAAAPSKTETQKGPLPLPCLVSGKADRMNYGMGLSRPLGRPCRRAEGKQAGRTPGTGPKKTTGCPGGGAAGQRGRMF